MAGTKTILLADDDEAILDSVVIMLEIHGYEVKHLRKGKDVKQAALFLPDLVVLDVWMSGIDGREICQDLKRDLSTKEIPVLMMSASRDVKDSVFEAGADDFIEKPFEMTQLIHKIESLLSLKEANK